jgi:putative ABC transport system substrate-binding protein
MGRIGRRQFLIATGALFTAALAAEAQQAGKVYRIGFLSAASGRDAPHPHAAFFDGLSEVGYIEGRNLIIERRFAAGNVDRLNEFAADLVRLKVDLIVASSTPAAQAAKKATSMIPIIFVAVADPVGAGLLASLSRPGRNITGVSTLSPDLSGKRLEILKEVLPKLAQVAVLHNPSNASNSLLVTQTTAAARKLGVQLQLLEVRAPNDIETALQAAVRGGASALIVVDDSLMFMERTRIAALSSKHRLPTISGFGGEAEVGGLMAYGVSLPDLFRRVVTYVDRVLKGAKPAELPVELPSKFELVINLKTAKTLGIQIPPSILQRADKVIE